MKKVRKEKVIKEINPREAYTIYLESHGDNFVIAKYIDAFNSRVSYGKYVRVITEYAEKFVEKDEIAILLDSLEAIDLKDEKAIINLISQSGFSIDKIKASLTDYIFVHRPDMYFNTYLLNRLNQKLEIYREYLKTLKHDSIYTASVSYAHQTMQLFLKSNYSIARFCYQYRISLAKFKEYLRAIKSDKNLYLKVLENIDLKEQEKEFNIKFDVYKILNDIKHNPDDYSIIDFLPTTNYSFDEITLAADKVLSPKDAKLLRTHVSDFKEVKSFSDRQIANLLDEKFIFNIAGELVEITKEEKIEIINYLKENDIPISTTSLRDAFTRYYQKTLFTNKSK